MPPNKKKKNEQRKEEGNGNGKKRQEEQGTGERTGDKRKLVECASEHPQTLKTTTRSDKRKRMRKGKKHIKEAGKYCKGMGGKEVAWPCAEKG